MKKIFIKEVKKELTTIYDILRWTITVFNSSRISYHHGTDNALDEAIRLILPTIKLPIDTPYEIYNAHLLLEERENIINQVMKRIHYLIPVSYLINKAWFCGYEIYVDNRVFIPRSPIAELINDNFSSLINYKPKYILDMCTGSGCIAIGCSYNFPDSKIHASDISYDALIIAKKNIKIHKLTNRIKLIQSNLFNNLKKKYDIIITNPPYVDEKDITNFPTEYYYEPKIALTNGKKDYLSIIYYILLNAKNYMTDRGILICEIGDNVDALTKKFPYIPFYWIKFKNGGKGVFMFTKKELCNININLIRNDYVR